MKTLLLFTAALASPPVFAHSLNSTSLPVLASAKALKAVGADILTQDAKLDVGYANLTVAQQTKLSDFMHANGKCGGFEVVPGDLRLSNGEKLLAGLREQKEKESAWALQAAPANSLLKRPEIVAALTELKEDNIRANVEWLSSYPSRNNRLPNPNGHVNDLEAKVRGMLSAYPGMFSVEQISHNRTQQKSLRVHLEGKSRPAEIIVLGGHLDSINGGWGGGNSARAPGADDNASGSSNLLEAMRVLITKGRPARSVEFFWYAGEESGLLGSAEIAQTYKSQNKNVVAVLQLDMTMFPGSGEFVVGNVQDFTSAWLREYLVQLNDAYIGVKLIPDECGYACSDHASWHRQGYPALMPFESDTANMNRKIHTERDLIDSTVSFRHSLVFAKIALAFAMDLANSEQRQPY